MLRPQNVRELSDSDSSVVDSGGEEEGCDYAK